jgi:hypothetical protein
MLSPKTLKTYFLGYKQRVSGITDVFALVKEDELQKRIKNIPTGNVALIIIIPSYDSKSPDRDNITEDAPVLMLLVKRMDRKDDTEDSYLDTLDEMVTKLKLVRKCMLDDKALCNNIMRHLSTDGIHTDPEIDYLGCFGYSMSFRMKDFDFV